MDIQKLDFKVSMKITSSIKILKFPDFSRILDKMLKFPDYFLIFWSNIKFLDFSRFSRLRSNPVFLNCKKYKQWSSAIINACKKKKKHLEKIIRFESVLFSGARLRKLFIILLLDTLISVTNCKAHVISGLNILL